MFAIQLIITMIDETSDIEACQLLTENAKNLISAISDALYHTQRASINVAKTKGEELGLTQHNIEASHKVSV